MFFLMLPKQELLMLNGALLTEYKEDFVGGLIHHSCFVLMNIRKISEQASSLPSLMNLVFKEKPLETCERK